MDHRRELRGECAECQGLCCVLLGFERSEWFAFDKPALTACRYLQPDRACAIHARLASEGQAGCAAYDCYGAGQRTCRLFGPATLRDAPALAPDMLVTFGRLRQLHELRWLLHEAGRLPLAPAHAAERAALLRDLEPEPEPDLAGLRALDLQGMEQRARQLLRSMHVYFPARAARHRLRVRQGPESPSGRCRGGD